MKKIGLLLLLSVALAFVLSAGISTAEKETKEKPYTLSALVENLDKLAEKEVVISGTIIGICKSGCKMWIAEGEYKKGDPYALVRAKDDAFKFEKDATGKQVILHGFAISKYMDYCSETGEEQEGVMDECETPVQTSEQAKAEQKDKEIAEKKDKEIEDGKKKPTLKDVTFFATKVEYK